jgi:peptidoglycan hydrolase-like protein with peptidoglycan-binding domain
MAVLAGNLANLRREINARWPHRDKKSDGWIADAAHPSTSDHQPDSRGVVHAIDVDVDGIDPKLLVKKAIAHPTTKYVIWNRTIWSRSHGFEARKYTGEDPHTSHVHISGRSGREFETNGKAWGLAEGVAKVPASPKKDAVGSRTLKLEQPRMRGDDVAFIQRFVGKNQAGKADGIFGPETEQGVRFYQKLRGIAVTGICDKHTFHEMGV